ncbi:MAG: sulfatase [Myxococcota bacterium]|nr:sulfatase [Myxococcota bacterium]
MRHVALHWVLPCAALSLCLIACDTERPVSEPAMTRAKNSVVLISLDTTRRDHLSVYGYDRKTSPNLDAMSADGIVMQNFLTTSSWTLPTHASLFTGLFPSSHGAHYSNAGNTALSDADGAPQGFDAFRANRLPDAANTLAETLKANGFQTHAIGAGPWFKPVFGLDQGFDHYDAAFDSLAGRDGAEVSELAINAIERAADNPFFLFLNYFDPHDPYDGHGTSWEQFLKPGPDFARSKVLAEYDSEILYMDEQLGRVFDTLRKQGLYDRSWIVVTNDHGEHFGEHELEGHGFSLYESVVRGVLIIKPPVDVSLELDPNTRAQSVDIMPTLLQGLGINLPSTMEGEPLNRITHPAMVELYRSAGNVRWKGERFRRELRALYDGDYKLLLSSKDEDPDAGLFDLRNDPDETNDLHAELPDVVNAMVTRFETWSASRTPLNEERAPDLDPETRRQMEALGYLDATREAKP